MPESKLCGTIITGVHTPCEAWGMPLYGFQNEVAVYAIESVASVNIFQNVVLELGALGKTAHRMNYCICAVLDAYLDLMVEKIGAESGGNFLCHKPRNLTSE